MAELIRVDFKQKQVLGRHQIGEFIQKPSDKVPEKLSYQCLCCQGKFSNDKDSLNYLQAVSWEVGDKVVYLCKNCIEDMSQMVLNEIIGGE